MVPIFRACLWIQEHAFIVWLLFCCLRRLLLIFPTAGWAKCLMTASTASTETTDVRPERKWLIQLMSLFRNSLNQRHQMLSVQYARTYCINLRNTAEISAGVNPLSYPESKECLTWTFCLPCSFPLGIIPCGKRCAYAYSTAVCVNGHFPIIKTSMLMTVLHSAFTYLQNG